MRISDKIDHERRTAEVCEQIAHRVDALAISQQIDAVMQLTPVLPLEPRLPIVNALETRIWDASRMLVCRRQAIEDLLQMAIDASPQVRAKFTRQLKPMVIL